MTDSLRQLQLVELDILKQALEICEKHSLTYYMLGGTLLGAVRHKGFIPWDDDIDIGLPRPDYEKFLEYARNDLFSPYQLHTISQNCGEYCYYYARVENVNVKILRKGSMKDVVIPAWIDVFPLDGVPNNPKGRSNWLKKLKISKVLFNRSQFTYFGSLDNSSNRPAYLKAINNAFLVLRLDRVINTRWAWKKLDSVLKENDYNQCNTLINACGYWGLKEMFPKSVYGKGRLYQFEDLMLNGPEDYDHVLKQMYGDYLTPLPEDQREHHHIELIHNREEK